MFVFSAGVGCIIYILLLAILYGSQRHLLFLAHAAPTLTPAEYGIKGVDVVEVTTEDGLVLRDWFAPPPKPGGRIIVFFHGAYENLGDIAGISTYFMERGFGIFLCEYRGFGGSPGEPSEQGLYADGRAGIKWLKEHGYKREQFVFLGASLGSGVAVQMAVETQPAFLALQSPYSSVVDVAKERYSLFPVDALIKDRFDSIAKIEKVKSSLLIIHGTDDTTVPMKFSKALFNKANKPKVFYILTGAGHDGLYSYMVDITTKWLATQTK
ncbi:MAG: alpha/beta hydrolase [Alphaproteobacteria bacterium]